MHHIYHTEALILSSRNFGEAGKYYRLFTRDLGMIVASAQGVRKMSSKLRYVLVDFSLVKVDLVRGKDFWRITSASKTGKLDNLAKHPKTLRVAANICRLASRLLAGEGENKEAFDDMARGLGLIEKGENIRDIEAVTVLRLLGHLGYIGEDGPFLRSPFEEEILLEAGKRRSEILRLINRALRETHL